MGIGNGELRFTLSCRTSARLFCFGALGLVGLKPRNLLGSAWALLLTPIYWLLLSLAAWRALDQLVRDPYRWEKTEHGLARNSRWMDVPEPMPAKIRDIAAGRRQRPQAAA